MDKLTEFVFGLARRFPQPAGFVREIESLPISKEKRGDFFLEIGNRLRDLSNFKLAIEVWKNTLGYYLDFGDKQGEAYCYGNLGEAYGNLGDSNSAIEYHTKALEISKDIGDKNGEATCYIGLGIVSDSLGDFKGAIEHIARALKIMKEIGDKQGEANCYGNLGEAYRKLGDFKGAITEYEKALVISKDNKQREARCYTNIGIAYRNLGDLNRAIEYQNKALIIKKNTGDKQGEANCYINLGNAYHNLGDINRTIEEYKKALKIYKEIKDQQGEESCYINLGNAYDKLGNINRAIEYQSKALDINKEIGDKQGEAGCYINLGSAYRNLGDSKRAIEYQYKALEIFNKIGIKQGEARCYGNLGETYHNLGDFKRVIEEYNKALKIFKNIGDIYGESICLNNLGFAYLDQENIKSAEECFREGIEIIEGMRRDKLPKDPKEKKNFLKNSISLFDGMVISQIKLGNKEKALEYSEKGKGRTILDYIILKNIEKGLLGSSLSFKEMQELALSIQSTIVHLRITEKGTYIFILKPNGKFRFETSDLTEKRLKELLVQFEEGKPVDGWIYRYDEFKRLSKKEEWFKSMDYTLKALYDELMKKIFCGINLQEKVVLIPNKVLNTLPLHSCFYEENGKRHYLLEDYEISYAPNCNILALCTEREKENRIRDKILSIGPSDPNLVYSKIEAKNITSLFKIHKEMPNCTKEELIEEMADYGIIHFSTHGAFELGFDFNSRLDIGDGYLTLADIFERVRLPNTWLVVLSCCETGLIDFRDSSDEYIGLQAGFLHSGSQL